MTEDEEQVEAALREIKKPEVSVSTQLKKQIRDYENAEQRVTLRSGTLDQEELRSVAEELSEASAQVAAEKINQVVEKEQNFTAKEAQNLADDAIRKISKGDTSEAVEILREITEEEV
jgi:predicted transcriptional regulator